MVTVVSVAIERLKVQTITDEAVQAWDLSYLGVIDRITFLKRRKHVLARRTDPLWAGLICVIGDASIRWRVRALNSGY